MTHWKEMRFALPVPLVGMVAYCVYGFTTTLSTRLDGDASSPTLARIAYGVGALVALSVLTLLLTASVRADARLRSR